MDKVTALVVETWKLSPEGKLRVAIGLIERDMPDRAEPIIIAALTQLRGIRHLGREAYDRLAAAEISRLSEVPHVR